MTRRWRTVRYGASIAVVLLGVGCDVAVPGTLGATLAIVLIGLGSVGVLSLIFYEVGLSEDRDRARRAAPPAPPPEHERKPKQEPDHVSSTPGRGLHRGHLERRRGERRRLR